LQQQSERFEQSDARLAHDGLVAVRRASAALHEIVGTMTEATMHGPSRLTGWTRGHVVSHLARNADIEEGAHRLARVQQEDLWAAHQRFGQATEGLAAADWAAQVIDGKGRQIAASLVPWMRLTEVLVHQVDLDVGVDFDRVAELVGPQAEPFIDYVVTRYEDRPHVPSVRLSVELPGGDERIWTFGGGADVSDVHGPVAAVSAWLTGREVPVGLVGDVPRLPAWL
jgi:maleylpyruvate isomerase